MAISQDEDNPALALVERWLAEAQADDAALAHIERRLAKAPTDAAKVKEAEDDLREFQLAINETRRAAGARILFPDVV